MYSETAYVIWWLSYWNYGSNPLRLPSLIKVSLRSARPPSSASSKQYDVGPELLSRNMELAVSFSSWADEGWMGPLTVQLGRCKCPPSIHCPFEHTVSAAQNNRCHTFSQSLFPCPLSLRPPCFFILYLLNTLSPLPLGGRSETCSPVSSLGCVVSKPSLGSKLWCLSVLTCWA